MHPRIRTGGKPVMRAIQSLVLIAVLALPCPPGVRHEMSRAPVAAANAAAAGPQSAMAPQLKARRMSADEYVEYWHFSTQCEQFHVEHEFEYRHALMLENN